jgi:predicted SAM-dependent methyltransferase
MKLRLIAGTINWYHPEEGWMNYHLDVSDRGIWDPEIQMTVYPQFVQGIEDLGNFREETFDEIQAHHVLEHLDFESGGLAIAGFHRILKEGGVLDIEVPDIGRVMEAWINGDHTPEDLQQWIYGEQLTRHEPGDSHRYGYREFSLRLALGEAGFTVPAREETGLALRFRAVK